MERKHFSLIIKLRVEDFNILACAIRKFLLHEISDNPWVGADGILQNYNFY